MKKFSVILLLLSACLAAMTSDELGALKIYKVKMPIYSKKKLQFMIFCEEMTRKADKIYTTDAIIDLIKRDTPLNKIVYLEGVKAYKLGMSGKPLKEFWKDKTSTNGFISTSKAIILQNSKVASGSEKVYFRSPQLDLNGVGFTANFDTRIVKVLKDVNIIIRMDSEDPKKEQEKERLVKVKSNSMILDMGKEVVTLIGNIKISDLDFNIFCERLVLNLKDKNKGSEKAAKGAFGASGISKITCYEKVKIVRKINAAEKQKNGEQKAFADKAVYVTSLGKIILTGKNPRIYRGKDMISGKKIVLWKESERLQAFKDCLVEMTMPEKKKDSKLSKLTRINSEEMDFDIAKNIGIFTGHVRVKNADIKLNCNKMTVYLQDRQDPKDKLVKSLIQESGKKDLKEIVCTGNVIITRINKASGKDERATAGKAVYTLQDNKIILSENNPLLISGRDSISGRKMVVWLDQNRLKVIKNSKIILQGKSIGENTSKLDKTTVLSDNSDLNYGADKLLFDGKVKVDNPQMVMLCDNMKIYLEKKKEEVKETASKDDLSMGGSGSKDVSHIVCVGDVSIDEPRARVNCDRMVINFRDKPANKKDGVGISSGDKREVDLIKCFGNVYMVNKPEDKKTKPSTITSDNAIINIPGNVADLIGKVKITEPRYDLVCDKMKIFAQDITPAQAKQNELENTKTDDLVPEHIGIGENKELTKIICFDNVVMTRKLPNESQTATGDKAVYIVKDHNVTLTGKKIKPTLKRGPTTMEGTKIILWTDSEKLDIKDGTLKNFDPGNI